MARGDGDIDLGGLITARTPVSTRIVTRPPRVSLETPRLLVALSVSASRAQMRPVVLTPWVSPPMGIRLRV